MAITFQDSAQVNIPGSGPTGLPMNTACAVNDLIVVQFYLANATLYLPTFTDNVNSGNYTVVYHSLDSNLDGGLIVGQAYMVANAVGTPTITVGASANYGGGYMIGLRFNGFTATPTPDTGARSFSNGNSATVSGSITNNFANELILSQQHEGTTYASPGGSWNQVFNSAGFIGPPYYQVLGGTGATSFSGAITSGFWDLLLTGYYNYTPTLLADGTSSGTTTVQTGTGGAAMPAMVVGQVLDVILMAQTGSALTDNGLSDSFPSASQNTFVNIRTYDDHVANGFIWDHWRCTVTVPVASPVIGNNWSSAPTKALIAVGILNNILTSNPTSFNYSTQNFQTSPSGANSQVSGYTSATLTSGKPYTVAVWGFSVNEAAAPAAGTSPIAFTQIGTCGAGLGTGACLTYETAQVIGAGASVQGTFTPVTGNTYTFAAAFNDIPLPVFPAGPMPRQIYIMP